MASLVLGPAASRACSQQEATDKVTQLSHLIQAKVAANPSEGQALVTKLMPGMQANQAKLASVCTQYGAMLKQVSGD